MALDRNYTIPVAIGTILVVAALHIAYWKELAHGALGTGLSILDALLIVVVLGANAYAIKKDNGDNTYKGVAIAAAIISSALVGIVCSEIRF